MLEHQPTRFHPRFAQMSNNEKQWREGKRKREEKKKFQVRARADLKIIRARDPRVIRISVASKKASGPIISPQITGWTRRSRSSRGDDRHRRRSPIDAHDRSIRLISHLDERGTTEPRIASVVGAICDGGEEEEGGGGGGVTTIARREPGRKFGPGSY